MTATSTMTGYSAAMVSSDIDREAVARLRYEVYIAEQGKPYPEADHERGLFLDDLDHGAGIVLVRDGQGDAIGTVRGNVIDSLSIAAFYRRVFEFGRFGNMPQEQLGVCSRLAVLAKHRHSAVCDLLFETIFAYGIEKRTRLCFAACAPALLRLFRHYGFREYASPIEDPHAGTLRRTVLVLDDTPFLESIQSPFFTIALANGLTSVDRPWLNAIFQGFAAK